MKINEELLPSVESGTATLTSAVASGSIQWYKVYKVVCVYIHDIKVSSNITGRTLIATGLPKNVTWTLFPLGYTNQDISSTVGLVETGYLSPAGELSIDPLGSYSFLTSHRLLGMFTYITSE